MAAKKSSSKSGVSEKKAPKKQAAKKKAARKKAAKKKPAAPRKTAAKQKAPVASPKTAASPKVDAPAKKTPVVEPPKGGVSSMDVTLGHIFALKPRVDRSFRQSNLGQAKRNLEDESYADLREAARAVAEEALAITRGTAQRPDKRRR